MTATSGTASPIKMFCSYAREDETFKDELLKHLRTLLREKVIEAWHDRMIDAGSDWEKQISDHLKAARVILLLISPDFLASDYCYDKEILEAMRRHDAGEACVIPIHVRPAYVKKTPFSKLQGLPTDIKPVSLWQNQDAAWVDVIEGIVRTVETLPDLLPSQPPIVPAEIPDEPPVANEPERVPPPVVAWTGDEPRISVGKKPDPMFLLANHDIQLISIPAGEFLMGDDDRSDNPRHVVYLDTYFIAKHPVTVKQYLAFCTATGYHQPERPSWGWKEDHPVVNVSWEDAQAYCSWLGKQVGQQVTLPTEAQWEKAARGTDGRKHPWGNEWDSNRLQCSKKSYGDAGGTAAVGSFPTGASPYGVLDMAGNVWEWCSDWYDSGYMKTAPTRNPTGPRGGSARVLRGGSLLLNNEDNFRCAYRNWYAPDIRYYFWGFRCVVSADSR